MAGAATGGAVLAAQLGLTNSAWATATNALAKESVTTLAPQYAPLVVPAQGTTGAHLITTAKNSARLKLKGVTVWGIPDYVAGSFAEDQHTNRDAICATVAAWGANHIRLRLLNDEWVHLTHMGTKGRYLQYVRDWVQSAKAHGLYIYLSWWDASDSSDGSTSGANWITNYSDVFPMMTTIYKALKFPNGTDDPAIFYEPFNEPHELDWAQWFPAMADTVALFRRNGYQGMLIIDTPRWSHDYSDKYMGALERHDTNLIHSHRHNLAFAHHWYANDDSYGDFDVNRWVAATGGAEKQHVIIESEFGNYITQVSTAWSSQITGYFRNSAFFRTNIGGMTAFIFGNWYDPNAMSSDPAGAQPTTWGNDVKDFLAKH